MNSSSVILGLWIVGIAISGVASGDTITFQPGLSYSWIIPPQSRPFPLSSSQPHEDGGPPDGTLDPRNESPIAPVGGYGYPPLYLRHSHEQLSLPNEFLIASSGSDAQQRNGGGEGGGGFSPMPIFRQLDPAVDCDGGPTCPNVDITREQQQPQQQHPTTIHRSNSAPVPSLGTVPDLNYWQQPEHGKSFSSFPFQSPSVNFPRFSGGGGGVGGGGIGLLFFVPNSASHLPVEQLIRQQLALHRTQFPIDSSINCEDAGGPGCRSRPAVGGLIHLLQPPPPPLLGSSRPSAPPATAVNVRNAENGNYASLPLDGIDSGDRRGGLGSSELNRKWRTIGERLVQNKQEQRQQQQWQLQQNQQELSILP